MKLFGNSSHSGHQAGHGRPSGEKSSGGGEILPKAVNSGNIPPQPPTPAPPKQETPPKKAEKPVETRQMPPKAHPKSGNKVLRGVLIGLGCVVLALLLAAVYFLFFYGAPPDITATPTPAQPSATIAPPTASPSPSSSASASPSASPSATPEESPEESTPPEDGGDTGEAPVVPVDSGRKDGVYTILLVGVDRESSSTDTIMVVSFDTKNHKLTGTSIPRDTLINIGWFTTPKKINAVYPGFKNNNEDPVEGLKLHIKSLLGFDVDNYVVVYLQAVEDAVNAIGGVEFNVPEGMYYSDPYQDLYINIDPGLQVLDGANALKLCRFRSTYAEGDLKRIRVQHDFLKAMASQMIQKGIPNLPELIEIILNDVDTDLTAENIVWFARQFLRCKDEDVVFQTAPNDPSGINNISFVGLRVDEWLQMINESINPYTADITTANVNILTFGGTAGIYSTTGAIAGGWISFACWSCSEPYHGPGEHVYADPAPAAAAPAPATVNLAPAHAPPDERTGPAIETVYADG